MRDKNKTNPKKDKKEKMPVGQVLRYNLLMLGKIWKMAPQFFFVMIATGIIDGISNAISTVFTYKLFNELDRPDVTFGEITGYILLILGINTAILIFYAWYHQYYKIAADKKLQFAMHSELFDHALKMDLICYDDPQFYNDYVWAMDESKGRALQVMSDVGRIIQYLITLSTLITLMLQVDTAVGLILLVGCILNAFLWEFANKLAFQKNERVKPYHRKNSYINRVFHLADYAKELRISSAGENLQHAYSDSITYITKEEVANGKKQYLLAVFSNLILTAARYLPVIILLFKLYRGEAQLGGFVASITVIWELNWSMYDLAKQIIRMPDNAQYIAKYLKFLSYKPKIISGDLPAETLDTIELRNVHFSYQPVADENNTEKIKDTKCEEPSEAPKNSLDGVSLTIKKGEKIAIVGYNGAGKTTLTKLLMRLYDPSEGEILYNGRNLKEYDIPSLRGRIGTVFQDYKIFAATVAENVLSDTCAEADRDIVTDALTKATFKEKLDSLEMGMDTHLTKEFFDEGVNLSGGESQKVAIARIFARPYDLIIMDEPSSALDPAAEYELNHTILEYARDKTVVFISHRLSTTRMADRILMFADGKLIESGSHDELMALNGKYAEMFLLQAEKYRTQASV
ncbi:MAG: ABC transporter ATP-binding protein [Clostridia bacterium]|nr:ABC transporter ATP-binding protein [Clostridia bacterium]